MSVRPLPPHTHKFWNNKCLICGLVGMPRGPLEIASPNDPRIPRKARMAQPPDLRPQEMPMPSVQLQPQYYPQQQQSKGIFSKFASIFHRGGKAGIVIVHCRTCSKLITKYKDSEPIGKEERIRRTMSHYKKFHPKLFKKAIKKGIDTRKMKIR